MRLLIFAILSCILSNGLGFQPSVTSRVTTTTTTRGSRQLSDQQPPMLATSATTSPDSSSSSKAEEWTKPRIHNTNWFRSGAVLVALGLAGTSPLGQLPSAQAGAAIHLFSFATWFGTVFYTTFIFGLTAFKNLPRQTFGKLQAKLFPKYFALGSIAILLQILTLRNLPLQITKRVTWSLGAALASTLLNQFILEPYSTKVMLERHDLENTEGGQNTDRYKELKKTFGKMHGMSSLSNLIALCGAVTYGFILSSLLVLG